MKNLTPKILLYGVLTVMVAVAITGSVVIFSKRNETKTTTAANPPSAQPSAASNEAAAAGEKDKVIAAAQAQLNQRHPGNDYRSLKADYCVGNYAIVTFVTGDSGSAAYLVKTKDVWEVVAEGHDVPSEELIAKGFPESVAKYPPPCPAGPREGESR